MTAVLSIRCHPDLRAWFVKESLRTGTPMNELVASMLADGIGKPELAEIPRKRLGSLPKQSEKQSELTRA